MENKSTYYFNVFPPTQIHLIIFTSRNEKQKNMIELSPTRTENKQEIDKTTTTNDNQITQCKYYVKYIDTPI